MQLEMWIVIAVILGTFAVIATGRVRSELAAYRNREPGPLADLDDLRLTFDWPAPDPGVGRRGRRHL